MPQDVRASESRGCSARDAYHLPISSITVIDSRNNKSSRIGSVFVRTIYPLLCFPWMAVAASLILAVGRGNQRRPAPGSRLGASYSIYPILPSMGKASTLTHTQCREVYVECILDGGGSESLSLLGWSSGGLGPTKTVLLLPSRPRRASSGASYPPERSAGYHPHPPFCGRRDIQEYIALQLFALAISSPCAT